MVDAATLSLIFLTCAVGLQWGQRSHRWPLLRSSWLIALILAIVVGLYSNVLSWPAILVIAALGTSARIAATSTAGVRFFSLSGFILLSIFAGFHLLPGFSNPRIIEGVRFADDSALFSVTVNFDKALVGIFILAYLHPRIERIQDFIVITRTSLPIFIITVSLVMLMGLFLGKIQFQPKWQSEVLYWAWVNLFITCVAEETFFRGLLQSRLAEKLSGIKSGKIISVIVAAILFGVAHFSAGIEAVILATLAGLGYGLVYQRTGRVEASILCHFGLNLFHILFFSYPYKIS